MIAKVAPFHAIAISRIAHDLEAEGREIIHMEFGQPSTGAPARAIAAAHHVLDTEPMGYWESNPLKERIARHYRDTYGVGVDREQVILTCGASPALVLALSCLFRPGARIALARPGYVAYRNTLRAMYLEPVEIGCGPSVRFQITAEAVDRLDPAPDGLIVASPANPTGTVIAPEELAAIADICRRKGIEIVSDEIYHGLSYGEATPSMLEVAPGALVINSFSKYFSMAGWRLGWLVVPAGLIGAARARMGNLFLTPPVLAQRAACVAFDCRDELDGHVDVYARRNRVVAGKIAVGLERRFLIPGLDRDLDPDDIIAMDEEAGHHWSSTQMRKMLPSSKLRRISVPFSMSRLAISSIIARVPWTSLMTRAGQSSGCGKASLHVSMCVSISSQSHAAIV